MVRKRPCRVCRRWFQPDPRPGDRQHTCSRPECQRERKRRSDGEWRRGNPNYWREDRLRKRVIKQHEREAGELDPTRRIDWLVAQAEIGMKASIIIEESGKVIADWAQVEIARQLAVRTGESGRHGGHGAQEQIAPRSRSP